MSNIVPFDFNGNQVRVFQDENGDPWFVAKDVCDVLEIANSRDAVADLDDDEKNTVVLNDGNRGNPNITTISESGFYSIALRSRKEVSKPFRRWVTREVLPSIRKTGKYEAESTKAARSRLAIQHKKPTPKQMRTAAFCVFGGIIDDRDLSVIVASHIGQIHPELQPLMTGCVDSVPQAPAEEKGMRPTELGELLGGLSGKKVNLLLEKVGLQESYRSANGRKLWKATALGASYSRVSVAAKANGTPVESLVWLESALPLLQEHITN